MALTVTSRGTGTHNTGATTLVPGGRSATLAVGSLGVLCMALDNAGGAGDVVIAPTTWTDAKGNVWTRRASALYDNGAASAGIEMAIYTAPITVALLTTDLGTITWNTGVSPVAKAWTWYEVIPSNGITPAFLNQATIAGATAANGQVITAESINVGDAVIAGYFAENVAAVTGDADSTNGSWAAQQTATIGTTTSGVRIATQQKVQTTAAGTQSYDPTVASQDRIAGYITVREVVAKTPQPTAASLALSAAVPAIATPVASLPGSIALTLSAAVPGVATPVASQPSAVALTVSPATPAVTTPVASLPTAAALVATTATPIVAATANIASLPTAAGLALSTAAPGVATPVASQPASVALALSAGTLVVALPVVAVPGERSLAATGATPDVLAPVACLPASSGLTLAGAVPGLELPVLSEPVAAAVIASGVAPEILQPVVVQPGTSTLNLAGDPPVVVARNDVAVVTVAGHLALALAAPTVGVTDDIVLTPAGIALNLSMFTPTVVVRGHEASYHMALTSFYCGIDGDDWSFRKGSLVPAGHPAVAVWPELFRPYDEIPSIEVARTSFLGGVGGLELTFRKGGLVADDSAAVAKWPELFRPFEVTSDPSDVR